MESSGGRRDIRLGNEDLCRLKGENERKERREKRKGERREANTKGGGAVEGSGGFPSIPFRKFLR